LWKERNLMAKDFKAHTAMKGSIRIHAKALAARMS
jgi:hypothetical protein